MYYMGAMDNQELALRVSQYPYTKDVIPGSGNWYYTQVDKKNVKESDIAFFEENAAKYYWHNNVMSDDKYTFDGWPLIIESSNNHNHTLSPVADKDGYVTFENPWEGGKFKVRESEIGDSVSHSAASAMDYLQVLGSTYSPTYLYGFGRECIGKRDDGAFAPILKINLNQKMVDYGAFKYEDLPIYDGVPLPSSVTPNVFVDNTFSHTLMQGT